MSPDQIKIPEPILAHLTEEINRCWFAPSERATAALEKLPRALPEGEVKLLAGDGGFGMYIEGRLDRIDGRLAIELFSDNRMSGESYYRVWEDGSEEDLPGPPPEGYEGDGDDYFFEAARARGFMQYTTFAGDLNRLLEGRG